MSDKKFAIINLTQGCHGDACRKKSAFKLAEEALRADLAEFDAAVRAMGLREKKGEAPSCPGCGAKLDICVGVIDEIDYEGYVCPSGCDLWEFWG